MICKWMVSVCAAGLLAGAAAATPIEFKMSGVVYDSRDNLGVFGLAGASLIGQSFTMTYVFDPALQRPTVNNATEYSNYSDADFRAGPSIGLGAWLTINGQTVQVGGQYTSSILLKETADDTELMINQEDYDADTGFIAVMETDIGDDSAVGYGSPSLGPWSGHVMPLNSFASWRVLDDSGDAIEWVSMDTRHVTIGAPTPAPEPASWALMVGGFGLIGAVSRARRRGIRFA